MDRSALSRLLDKLLTEYGPQKWWPAAEPWEMVVGAILTQRASWKNAAAAIEAVRREGLLSVRGIAGSSETRLASIIHSSVFHNAKAAKLKAFARAVCDEAHGDLGRFLSGSSEVLRDRLLRIHGVGPETADAVLLYAAGAPTFIADAYAFRLFERLGLWDEPRRYERLRARVMASLPGDAGLCGELHALIVCHGKARCRARPRCGGCPLVQDCPSAEVDGDAPTH
jgi:endonuclease-3 related protein